MAARILTPWLAAAAVLLAGCESIPHKVAVDFPPEPGSVNYAAAVPPPAPAATGSLYQAARYRPGFEDRRARLVGDTLTIQIVESLSASQVSSSTANRTSSLSAGVTAFPFLKSSSLNKLNADLSTANDFSGEGGTQSANTFSGAITATVTGVLPNGHLTVAGEKQIGVNQNVDVLRFTGTVDPRAILPGSVVSSQQVANVRVESRGRGAQAEAQTVGILSRIFMSLLPF
jgi:flagellar L-ring protein precursor FlgH